jgi:hypothetical protein
MNPDTVMTKATHENPHLPSPPPAGGLECQQCGRRANPEISWLRNCGVLWKVVVWCKVCKAAAEGPTHQEAEKRFANGLYKLEAL